MLALHIGGPLEMELLKEDHFKSHGNSQSRLLLNQMEILKADHLYIRQLKTVYLPYILTCNSTMHNYFVNCGSTGNGHASRQLMFMLICFLVEEFSVYYHTNNQS